MAPKSILKKTTDTVIGPPTSTTATNREQRNLDLALHHARLIQQQKDIEAEILGSIEALLELPTSSHADPARPDEADAQQFRTRLTPFQPSDYDALIEERHAANLCGYALCLRPPRRDYGTARMRTLRGMNGQDLRIVPKAKTEEWCSEDCARRALYVKVQLSEEPAWLRGGSGGEAITLLPESDAQQHTLPLRPKAAVGAVPQSRDDVSKAMADLANERGDKVNSGRPKGLVSSSVVEKQQLKPVPPPSSSDINVDAGYAGIEGYEPKLDFSELPIRNKPAARDGCDYH